MVTLVALGPPAAGEPRDDDDFMCVTIKPGLMVRVKQFSGPRPPMPLPLESGFSATGLYEIVGLHCPSESGEAYCILVNDLGQLWFISNRHLQVCPESSELKVGLNRPPHTVIRAADVT